MASAQDKLLSLTSEKLNIFQLKAKQNMDPKKIHFAKSTFSNLIGGISYFTGKLIILNKKKRMLICLFS